jgi:hypothetical protein
MIETVAAAAKPRVPAEVREFAIGKGLGNYLDAVVSLARTAFPSSELCVGLGRDADDETHHYIALDVAASSLSSEELLAGQRAWSSGFRRVCPSHLGVFFVLGWQ